MHFEFYECYFKIFAFIFCEENIGEVSSFYWTEFLLLAYVEFFFLKKDIPPPPFSLFIVFAVWITSWEV